MTSEFTAGSSFGQYVLDAYVGAGSFGQVWKAHRADTGEVVAIKVLTSVLQQDAYAALRTDVEILAGSAVGRSPHIARVLGGGSEPSAHVVMEFIDGTDLAAVLAKESKLPPSRTIEIGDAIADALHVLNAASIVHRDIKPANVMIDKSGVIKLTDFGVAKIVGYETITMTGQVAMTMAYAAPEVWEDDDDTPFGRPGHRSDLYSLGVLLYQCLTGDTPFRGNYGVLYRAHRERHPNLDKLPEQTPASLREVIRLCLEKRQAERPEDASTCLRLLRRAKVEAGETAGEPAQNEPMRFGPWHRLHPHPTQPWAWRCRHQSTDAEATVEVFFASSVEAGQELRQARLTNALLTSLGAERIIETNRLLLRPDEAWQEAPEGAFQFWLAREDNPPSPADTVTSANLIRVVQALQEMDAIAAREGIQLSPRPGLIVGEDGSTYLARPGLTKPKGVFGTDALAALSALPLDATAAKLVSSARDFDELVRQIRVTEGETLLQGQASALSFAVDNASGDLATRRVNSTPAAAGSNEVASSVSCALECKVPGRYLLTARNESTRSVNLMLHGLSEGDDLAVSVRPSMLLGPGESAQINVSVVSRRRRRVGRRVMKQFSVVTAVDGGRSGPPIVVSADYEDRPSRWPIFVGVAGLTIAAALAGVLVLGSQKTVHQEGASIAQAAPAASPQALATETDAGIAAPAEVAPAPPPPATATLAPPVLPAGGQPPSQQTGAPPPQVPAPATNSSQASSSAPGVLPTVLPSSTQRVCSATPPSNDEEKFEGCRIFETILDGTARSFSGSRVTGSCKDATSAPSDSSVQFLSGAVDLTIAKWGAQTRLYLATLPRSSYVVDYDVSFAPGSRTAQLIPLRQSGNGTIFLSAQAFDNTLNLWYWDGSARTDLVPPSTLSGLQTGRRVTIAAAVSPERITAFVDGRTVFDLKDSRLPGPQRLELDTQSCTGDGKPAPGTLRLYEARVYELAAS